jgi:putative transposase
LAIVVKPTTILNFYKALVRRKYSRLYSNNAKENPGRKAQDQDLIDLVIEIKQLNPSFGYGRIAMQIFEAFGIIISRFAVGRILRKNNHKDPSANGPSWLTFIGNMKDSLWSVDIFRCESIGPASRTLKSHWVMVILDQYSRRIIGFAVHAGNCNGIAYCRMFNKIVSGNDPPKYLSSDNDPLFLFHRWQANLRILEIDEVKSVPGNPASHPFVERIIGTTRREYLDHLLFFNDRDLQNKLDQFQAYYNDIRAHSSLDMKTPTAMAFGEEPTEKVVSIDHRRWKQHCNGLYKLPMAA